MDLMTLNPKGLRQLRSGHPWLYDDMVNCQSWPQEPGLIALGEHFFLYTPHGKLKLRRLGPGARLWPGESVPRNRLITSTAEFQEHFASPLTTEFLRHARLQSQLVNGDACFRWIFAENQGLPGLVLDVFDRSLVAQIQTAPLEYFWPVLKEILEKAWCQAFPEKTDIRWIEDRSSGLRKIEGLSIEAPGAVAETSTQWINWNGLQWKFRPGASQKTGAYLDQRENHLRSLEWARRLGIQRAWDLCCFEGGFGLHLAKAGLEVLFLDQSEQALGTLRENLEANKINPDQHKLIRDDVFRFLKEAGQKEPRSVPAIILDPPSFTRSRKEKGHALRGYFELHRQAMKTLQPGGLLVTSSCSHHITAADLLETLREASHSTRRDLRIIDRGGPSPDHGAQSAFPESDYLHAFYAVVGS